MFGVYVRMSWLDGFLCPLEWCCPCEGLLCLRVWVVCVAGVVVREDWAGLLLPGGSRRKERCYESVCVSVGVVGVVKYFKYQVYLQVC
jgi:hypothetical protein